MMQEGEHPAASSPVALTRVPYAGELGRHVAIATAAKMPPPPCARMQSVADSRYCVCGGRPAVGSPGEAAEGLTLSGRWWGKPSGVPVRGEATLLAGCPSPARRGCSRHHSHLPTSRPSTPVASRCHPALLLRGPFSLALPGWERSLIHPGWDPADAGRSSLISSPCACGRR